MNGGVECLMSYPIEGTRCRAREGRAEMCREIVDANVFIFHVPPRANVCKATGPDARDELKDCRLH